MSLLKDSGSRTSMKSQSSPESTDENPARPIRLAILQRVCTGYRVPLFEQLSETEEVDMTLFIGEDVPNTKIKSGPDLRGINYRKLKTLFLPLNARTLQWHVGLVGELRKFNPDVILCEGESHFVGYLQAIGYKYLFNRRVALMHWCYISLPGWPSIGGKGFRSLIKAFFRRFFDAFVVYSSFSKECLLKLGQPDEKVFVATNVGGIQRFLSISDSMTDTTSKARQKLGLPERFTVLYLGTLDENKRPGVMLDLAKKSDSERFNFVLLGTGPLLESLLEQATREELSNVFLPGRMVDELPLYLRSADVLMIPGRGGIVISEAMAFGLPIIVHQADGTEYDLVQDKVTGFHLSGGSVDDFYQAIKYLQINPDICAEMGQKSKQLVETKFTIDNMVNQIKRAAHYVKKASHDRNYNT
ncbi:glycosyltransferase [Candidatus Marinimicrobia bacterium MT.SAG.2]|nr:glycosyltransferase [Candidatus Marinimicrobia bacterium MT.SAG.2]